MGMWNGLSINDTVISIIHDPTSGDTFEVYKEQRAKYQSKSLLASSRNHHGPDLPCMADPIRRGTNALLNE